MMTKIGEGEGAFTHYSSLSLLPLSSPPHQANPTGLSLARRASLCQATAAAAATAVAEEEAEGGNGAGAMRQQEEEVMAEVAKR